MIFRAKLFRDSPIISKENSSVVASLVSKLCWTFGWKISIIYSNLTAVIFRDILDVKNFSVSYDTSFYYKMRHLRCNKIVPHVSKERRSNRILQSFYFFQLEEVLYVVVVDCCTCYWHCREADHHSYLELIIYWKCFIIIWPNVFKWKNPAFFEKIIFIWFFILDWLFVARWSVVRSKWLFLLE